MAYDLNLSLAPNTIQVGQPALLPVHLLTMPSQEHKSTPEPHLSAAGKKKMNRCVAGRGFPQNLGDVEKNSHASRIIEGSVGIVPGGHEKKGKDSPNSKGKRKVQRKERKCSGDSFEAGRRDFRFIPTH